MIKKNIIHYMMVVFGLLILGIGLYSIKTITEAEGIMKTLPYMGIGLGCGIFGYGMGEIISRGIIENHPETNNQIKIEKQDERNIAIGNLAKAKAYNMMIFIYGALILTFAFLGIDIIFVLLLAFVYIFVIGYYIYYRIKYEKEM